MTSYTMLAPTAHPNTHTGINPATGLAQSHWAEWGGREGCVKVQQNELTLDYNHEFINLIFLNS